MFVAVPLLAAILGTAYALIGKDPRQPADNKVRQAVEAATFESGTAEYRKPSTGLALQTLPEAPGRGHKQRKSQTLPSALAHPRGDGRAWRAFGLRAAPPTRRVGHRNLRGPTRAHR